MSRAARGYTNLEYDLDRGRARRPLRPRGGVAVPAHRGGGGGGREQQRRRRDARARRPDGVPPRPAAPSRRRPPRPPPPPERRRGARRPPGRRAAPRSSSPAASSSRSAAGFRIPDVLRRSGAALVEVGTTNRTYPADYEAAIGPRTRVLLSVHRSNFRLAGFIHDTPLEELVRLGRERDLWVVDDLGSGTLLETAPFGLGEEPTVQARVRAGPDLVTFSGDKLLGAPQAGHPRRAAGGHRAGEAPPAHARAPRRQGDARRARRDARATTSAARRTAKIPVWRAIALSPEALRERARGWLAALGPAGAGCEVRESTSAVGGGSLPEVTLPTDRARPRRPAPRPTGSSPGCAPAIRPSSRASRTTAWCSTRAR